MNNYNDECIQDYSCPDCKDAKLQSEKNARKINEVIEQVNALIQVNNEISDFIEEKTNEVLREAIEKRLDDLVGDAVGDIAEEKVNEALGGVTKDLSDVITEIDNIKMKLQTLDEQNGIF